MWTEFQLTYQIDTTPWSAILILCLIPEPGPAVSTDRPSQCSLAQPRMQILAFKSAGDGFIAPVPRALDPHLAVVEMGLCPPRLLCLVRAVIIAQS